MAEIDFSVSSDPARLQFKRVHHFLSTEAYWCLGIPEATLERAIRHSLNFSLFENSTGHQIGYARVVSDQATFAWLCDVYVESGFRGRGLAHRLLRAVMEHPDLQGLRRFALRTRDSHGLYRKYGFHPTSTPERWMEKTPPTRTSE